MANYNTLKSDIQAAIYQNGENAITGQILQEQLLSMVTSLGAGYQYGGVATPSTNPGEPDYKVFYLAGTEGTYTNFGGIVVANEVAILYGSGTSWTKADTGIKFVSVSQNTLTIGGEDKGQLAGQIEQNPEWVQVVVDSNGYILYGVKTNGKFYFGAGCPPQVVQYVNDLLSNKVDKIVGKSLIDAEFASSHTVITNPEFLKVVTDADGKIVEGIKIDGTRFIAVPFESQGLIQMAIDNPEWARVVLDKEEKIICGIKKDGKLYADYGITPSLSDYVKEQLSKFNTLLKVSVLGDSISTFAKEGYCIDGYSLFYPNYDVLNVNDTWWKQTINQLGGKLEINASYTGSTASNHLIGFAPRVPLLGNPDMIFIALGTNDWSSNIAIGTIDYDEQSPDLSKFAPAYIDGIKKTMAAYPTATIICMVLKMSDDYANTIKAIALHYNLTCVDVREEQGEETHPDKSHMFNMSGKTLANVSSGLKYVSQNI